MAPSLYVYDTALVAAARPRPQTIADVLAVMHTIDATCVDGDGLKWFNWLYLQVTQAVEARVNAGGFTNAAWWSWMCSSRVCISVRWRYRFRVSRRLRVGRRCSVAGTIRWSRAFSSP